MPHMALPRWTRWLLVALASVVGLLVVAVALLQTSPVATWAVRRLLGLVPLNPGYALDFRSVYATVLDRWWGVDSRSALGGRFAPVPYLG